VRKIVNVVALEVGEGAALGLPRLAEPVEELGRTFSEKGGQGEEGGGGEVPEEALEAEGKK